MVLQKDNLSSLHNELEDQLPISSVELPCCIKKRRVQGLEMSSVNILPNPSSLTVKEWQTRLSYPLPATGMAALQVLSCFALLSVYIHRVISCRTIELLSPRFKQNQQLDLVHIIDDAEENQTAYPFRAMQKLAIIIGPEIHVIRL